VLHLEISYSHRDPPTVTECEQHFDLALLESGGACGHGNVLIPEDLGKRSVFLNHSELEESAARAGGLDRTRCNFLSQRTELTLAVPNAVIDNSGGESEVCLRDIRTAVAIDPHETHTGRTQMAKILHQSQEIRQDQFCP
jgi:hypothetical protein